MRRKTLRRIMTAAALALLALVVPGTAFASLTIDETHYEAGVLVVRGKAAPKTEVAIDGRYKKNAAADGVFVFRLNYKPEDCRVTVSAGRDSTTRDVSNCTTPDGHALDSQVPIGTTLPPPGKR